MYLDSVQSVPSANAKMDSLPSMYAVYIERTQGILALLLNKIKIIMGVLTQLED